MTVTVQLRGGLGNQLFQYAAGFSVSMRHRTDLRIDVSLLPAKTVDRGGVRRWPEEISSFAHSGQIVDRAGGSSSRRRVLQSLAGRERAIGDSGLAALHGGRVYARESTDDLGAFERLSANARINAYCGTPAFFASVADIVAEQVRTVREPGEWYRTQQARIIEERPIALHVRWGDYLNLKHVYGTVGAGYYSRAIRVIADRHGPDRPIWLYSDDPDGAAEYLSDEVQIANIVRPDARSTTLENLLLLSSSSALVCANSSFSWWAAFLSRNPLGTIVFPRPMFGACGPAEPKDLLDSDWIQVGRD